MPGKLKRGKEEKCTFLKKTNSDLHCRRYTEEEFFNGDADSDSESSSEESESDEDEEWRKTKLTSLIKLLKREVFICEPETSDPSDPGGVS